MNETGGQKVLSLLSSLSEAEEAVAELGSTVTALIGLVLVPSETAADDIPPASSPKERILQLTNKIRADIAALNAICGEIGG